MLDVRITDIYGRSLKVMKGTFDQTFRFGSNLKGGTYFAEVIQGNIRQVVKLIKL